MLRLPPALSLLLPLLLALGAPSARGGESLAAEKYQLDNGLTVILKEDHRLPLVAVDLWYHVGSREEREGRSGFTHLFEHLMFMGTERVPQGGFDETLEAEGGWSNASTDFDRTDYYLVGPARLLPTMLWLDADRMATLGAAMTQEKLDLQRDVVRNEIRESYENAPYAKAELRLYAELFPQGHPYHHHVIGSHTDLAEATVDDVKGFFSTYYVPNNATLVVVGDFDRKATRETIARLFGSIPRGSEPPRRRHPWYEPDAERRVTLADDVQLPRTTFAWVTAPFFQPGDAELDLVADVLTEGKNGRLYKRLVHEERIAQDVSAWQESLRMGSVFRIQATAVPGVPLEKLEAAIDEELARLTKEGPTRTELDRTVATLETTAVSGLQSVLAVADLLQTYDAYLGAPDRLTWDLDRYRNATPETVSRAAARWLDPARRLVLRVVPRGGSAAGEVLDQRPAGGAPTAFQAPLPAAFRLANGLEVWHLDIPSLPLVSTRLVFRHGSSADLETRRGTAMLTGQMLLEGAGNLDALQFAGALADLGTGIWTSTGRDATYVSMQALRRNIDAALGMLALAVREPRFEEAALERLRTRHVNGLKQFLDEPEELAAIVVYDAFFAPVFRPYAGAPSGYPTTVEKIREADLRKHHLAYHRPESAVLLLAGDLRLAEARALAETHFGGWTRGASSVPAPPATAAAPKPGAGLRTLLVHRPGAPQTVMHLLARSVPWGRGRDPAWIVANEVLGGSFTSRLNAVLREEKGYTYGAYSALHPIRFAGVLSSSTAVETDVTGKAMTAFLGELRRLGTLPPTEEEIARAVSTLRSNVVQGLEDLSGVVGAFTPDAEYGTGVQGLRAYVAALETVDGESVARVAKGVAALNEAVLVLVGDREKILPELERLGLPAPKVLTAEQALVPSTAR